LSGTELFMEYVIYMLILFRLANTFLSLSYVISDYSMLSQTISYYLKQPSVLGLLTHRDSIR